MTRLTGIENYHETNCDSQVRNDNQYRYQISYLKNNCLAQGRNLVVVQNIAVVSMSDLVIQDEAFECRWQCLPSII